MESESSPKPADLAKASTKPARGKTVPVNLPEQIERPTLDQLKNLWVASDAAARNRFLSWVDDFRREGNA